MVIMNTASSVMGHIKDKSAQIVSNALIAQGEQGVKFSSFIIVSEADIPIELMQADSE